MSSYKIVNAIYKDLLTTEEDVYTLYNLDVMIGNIKTDITFDFDNIKDNENSKIQNKSNNKKVSWKNKGSVTLNQNSNYSYAINSKNEYLIELSKEERQIVNEYVECEDCQKLLKQKINELENQAENISIKLSSGYFSFPRQKILLEEEFSAFRNNILNYKNNVLFECCEKHKLIPQKIKILKTSIHELKK